MHHVPYLKKRQKKNINSNNIKGMGCGLSNWLEILFGMLSAVTQFSSKVIKKIPLYG